MSNNYAECTCMARASISQPLIMMMVAMNLQHFSHVCNNHELIQSLNSLMILLYCAMSGVRYIIIILLLHSCIHTCTHTHAHTCILPHMLTHAHMQDPGLPAGVGQDFDNCKVLDETLQLSWRVDNDNSQVQFQLCGCATDPKYVEITHTHVYVHIHTCTVSHVCSVAVLPT